MVTRCWNHRCRYLPSCRKIHNVSFGLRCACSVFWAVVTAVILIFNVLQPSNYKYKSVCCHILIGLVFKWLESYYLKELFSIRIVFWVESVCFDSSRRLQQRTACQLNLVVSLLFLLSKIFQNSSADKLQTVIIFFWLKTIWKTSYFLKRRVNILLVEKNFRDVCASAILPRQLWWRSNYVSNF